MKQILVVKSAQLPQKVPLTSKVVKRSDLKIIVLLCLVKFFYGFVTKKLGHNVTSYLDVQSNPFRSPKPRPSTSPTSRPEKIAIQSNYLFTTITVTTNSCPAELEYNQVRMSLLYRSRKPCFPTIQYRYTSLSKNCNPW